MAKRQALPPKVTTVNLTSEDRELIERLRQKFGLDFTSLVRLAIRQLAEAHSLR